MEQEILDNLIRQQVRGNLSEELHNHLKEALEEVRQEIYRQWLQCSPEQWVSLKAKKDAIDMFEQVLLRNIGNGAVAKVYAKQ